jgi:ammonia channel protein AmtB
VAGAAALLTWLFCDYWRGNKLSASGACIGLVVGTPHGPKLFKAL